MKEYLTAFVVRYFFFKEIIMNKFYDVSEFPNLIKKDDSVQNFGCPFFLEINDVVRDYVGDAFCWI